MKSWMTVTVSSSLMLALVACSRNSQRIEVSCDSFYKQPRQTRSIEITSGEELELDLCTNPTTGFLWEDPAQVSDPGVIGVEMLPFDETSIKGDSEPVGAPGVQRWTIKAGKPGAATLELSYSQPWEGGEKAAWTFQLSVTVR